MSVCACVCVDFMQTAILEHALRKRMQKCIANEMNWVERESECIKQLISWGNCVIVMAACKSYLIEAPCVSIRLNCLPHKI